MRIGFLLVGALLAIGCQQLGPTAIKLARSSYNDAVETTGAEQTLLNMVRVYQHKPMQIVDVTAINSQSQFQAQMTPSLGTPMSGGHFGQTEGLSGQLQYQEGPTVTYTPLQGAALVQQVTVPITPDSIAQLYDSDWELGTILTFVADRLAVRPNDLYVVIDNLMVIDRAGALVIAATKSAVTPGAAAGTAGVQNDTLLLMFDPSRAWDAKRLEAMVAWQALEDEYGQTFLAAAPSATSATYSATLTGGGTVTSSASLPTAVPATAPAATQPGPLPYVIELRMVPSMLTTANGNNALPVLRTRSALGTLKQAVSEELRYTIFVSPDSPEYVNKWKPHEKEDLSFISYTVDGSGVSTDKKIDASHLYTPSGVDLQESKNVLTTDQNSRHFICILHKPGTVLIPPGDTFVSTYYDHEWYYIGKDDAVSQRNFQLLNLILTIEAVPPPSSSNAPTPTIAVGGSGH